MFSKLFQSFKKDPFKPYPIQSSLTLAFSANARVASMESARLGLGKVRYISGERDIMGLREDGYNLVFLNGYGLNDFFKKIQGSLFQRLVREAKSVKFYADDSCLAPSGI